MRSMKVLLMVGAMVSAVAAACGGSTSNSGGGNESDSGSGSGGSSGSSSGGGDATSSSSSGSSSGTGSSSGSGSSSGGMVGDGGLTCTPTSCGASGLCCVSFANGMLTSTCVTGTMCPTGARQLCDPNNPMCPTGEVCRARMGSMYGTCRVPGDGGFEGGFMDAAGGG